LVESSPDVLSKAKVREVAGLFYSRRAIEAAVEDLLLNGFDRADIDRLGALDEVLRRTDASVPSEEAADLPITPRQPVLTRDDITVGLILAASLFGAAAGVGIVLVAMATGRDGWSAGILGTIVGLCTGGVAALVMARAFRREDLQGLEALEFSRGVVLWVRVHSPEQEAMAQDILVRNGGKAVRVHEIEIEQRPEDLPLGTLRPDPWLGSEPLGHP
jgi:hypothetical protein